ncbi:MAG: GIY-YIG nuclease family protein [Oscillospiraceae bacterium]
MERQRRKELLQSYRDRKITGGAYRITNTVTGRQFIDAETDLAGARNRFVFSQRMNTCTKARLHADWAKYGPEAFSFEILEEIEKRTPRRRRNLQRTWRNGRAVARAGTDNLY